MKDEFAAFDDKELKPWLLELIEGSPLQIGLAARQRTALKGVKSYD